jgi:hypothetical protein
MRPFLKDHIATGNGEGILAPFVSQDLEGFLGRIKIAYRLILGIEEAEPAGGLASVLQGTPDGAIVGVSSKVESLDLSAAGIQDGQEGLLQFFFNVCHAIELALFLALSQIFPTQTSVSAWKSG